MPSPLPARASEEEEGMETMTIGAKYRATLKDPGTSGVLRVVRAFSLPVSAPLCPLPSETMLMLRSEDCVCM